MGDETAGFTEPDPGTELVTQLGEVMGGPEVPDPETEAVDLRRKVWNLTRLGESMAESENLNVRRCGEQILAVLGDAALPVAAVLDRSADVAAVEGAAAVLERRYPAGRDERLDNVLDELRALARAWRRMAAEAGKRSEEEAGNGA